MREYVAHKKIDNEGTEIVQTVKEHCENVAQLARAYSVSELKAVTYICGLLHDVGKYQYSFQKRINGEDVIVEHSTCGAKEVESLSIKYNIPKLIMELCIAGHHTGIPDIGLRTDTPDMATLRAKLARKFEDYSVYQTEISLPELRLENIVSFLSRDCDNYNMLMDKIAFITRYVFSCVVDADSIDTAKFSENDQRAYMTSDFIACRKLIEDKLDSFVIDTQLQRARSVLQNQVFSNHEDGEVFLMNMPTGSGKTLCSIKYALDRAIINNKKHIIYVIPYNSIIDQTVEELEGIFGEKANILRHQSTYTGIEKGEDYRESLRIASENWDADIIVTTAVQFFDSFYSNKRGKLRKIHNIANSVLIFDEAHLMPRDYFQPCLQAVGFTVRYLNSQALFLTATMPNYDALLKRFVFRDIKVVNLIKDKSEFKLFKKCKFVNLGILNTFELIKKASGNVSSLIVVNKKKTAKEIYNLCSGEKYHLSTYMTGYDREKTITTIKNRLKNLEMDFPGLVGVSPDRRITVVSTSLVEAGVDMDFASAFRELSGLDNILQTGGRCNREGRLNSAQTFVFDFKDDFKTKPTVKSNITGNIIRSYEDFSCDEAIEQYYRELYSVSESELESHSIHNGKYGNYQTIMFKKYAEDFNIIETNTVSIVIPETEECRDIFSSLKWVESIMSVSRKVQKYTCSVYENEFNILKSQNAIEDYETGIWFLTNMDYYTQDTGITFEGKDHII